MGDGRHNSAHHDSKHHKQEANTLKVPDSPHQVARESFCSQYLDELSKNPLTGLTDTNKMGQCWAETKTAAGKQVDKAQDAAVDFWHTYQIINPILLGPTLMNKVSEKLNEITDKMK